MFGMRRREFITLLGGAAAWPLGGWAQQGKVPVIGLLSPSTASTDRERIAALKQRLAELGVSTVRQRARAYSPAAASE
jgi:putative tryptophan/tyrosine transport system substrate-binding protein